LWSEPTVPGAIQVPPDGRPLVLMADRQTVGGYPLLGAVLSPDCRRLSQASPGTRIKFKAVKETEADRILWLSRNFEQELKLGRQRAAPSPHSGLQP
jgi:allophanate hydrolase subunit 2